MFSINITTVLLHSLLKQGRKNSDLNLLSYVLSTKMFKYAEIKY